MSKNLYLEKVGKNAKTAAKELPFLKIKKRNDVLKLYSIYLKKFSNLILKKNRIDIANAKKSKTGVINRLELNIEKITQIRNSIKKIIKFSDPLEKKLALFKRPNGLIIKKVSIPIGVIGVIYESRPNVTSDVSALCFKSGNSVILRGGSEAFNSNKILSDLFRKALRVKNCNENYIQFINNKKRSNVDYLLSEMKEYIDVMIPRGGKNLVKKIQIKSKIPIIGHLEGICHIYVDKEADLKMAIKIVENAKMRNFSICGAVETLLIDKKCLKINCEPI